VRDCPLSPEQVHYGHANPLSRQLGSKYTIVTADAAHMSHLHPSDDNIAQVACGCLTRPEHVHYGMPGPRSSQFGSKQTIATADAAHMSQVYPSYYNITNVAVDRVCSDPTTSTMAMQTHEVAISGQSTEATRLMLHICHSCTLIMTIPRGYRARLSHQTRTGALWPCQARIVRSVESRAAMAQSI
jgi:hypothetical protein